MIHRQGDSLEDPLADEVLIDEALEIAGHDGSTEFQQAADDDELCDVVSDAIADGKVVCWFQDRMEFGPRALGSRSILGDGRVVLSIVPEGKKELAASAGASKSE